MTDREKTNMNTADVPENEGSTNDVGDNHKTNIQEGKIDPKAKDSAIDEKRKSTSDDRLAKTVSAISNDDNVVYPKGLRLAIVFVSLCFAVFLVALDQTIIATAM